MLRGVGAEKMVSSDGWEVEMAMRPRLGKAELVDCARVEGMEKSGRVGVRGGLISRTSCFAAWWEGTRLRHWRGPGGV